MGTQARAGLYQLKMALVCVLISKCNAEITLMLQSLVTLDCTFDGICIEKVWSLIALL